MFRRAVEIDPEYASAYAGMADALALTFLLFTPDMKLVDEAKVNAMKALELEPDLAEAHLARGMVYSCIREYEPGNQEFEQAMRLDPKLFEAPYYWGRNLHWQGRFDEAVRVFRVAQSLRPESFDVATTLTMSYQAAGRLADAESMRRHALKLMEERVELNPDDPRAWSLMSSVYAALHDRDRALEAVRRALAIDNDALTVYNVACTYAMLGEQDTALETLEKAVAMGWRHREWLTHDTDFDPVRETPRFRRILESL
jgi:tetratricopeptide (TPR) repeat protein